MHVSSINPSVSLGMPTQGVTNPITLPKKENDTEGYAPITASLWGKRTEQQAIGIPFIFTGIRSPQQPSYDLSGDFGAVRPTNNPKNFPEIEADTQSGFRLSSLDMPMICPDCGKPIMTKPIFSGIKAELDAADEKDYLATVDKHSEFLLPQEQKILAHLQKLQAQEPEKSVRELVVEERQRRLDSLEAKQYSIMDEIAAVGEGLKGGDKIKVEQLSETSSNIIFERSNTFAFQRGKFIELVENLHLKDKEAQAEIMGLAEELPSSLTSEDAWFVKYGGLDKKKQPYSSRTITEKLLAPAYTNTDHVHPWNRGGYDAVSNFWLMHARCNIIKTDKPFTEWLNEDRSHRIDYIGQYLRDAQEAIDKSDDPKMHPKYDLYSAKLAKTIYYETDGDVDYTEEFPLPEDYDVPRPEDNEKKKAA